MPSLSSARLPPAQRTINFDSQLISDGTFSSVSAQKFRAYDVGPQSERLAVPRLSHDRELSCGGNTATQAEGKTAHALNHTKTPKLGMHLKTVIANRLSRKANLDAAGRKQRIKANVSTLKFLSVPGAKSRTNTNMHTSSADTACQTAMLSTWNQTYNDRSSEEGVNEQENSSEMQFESPSQQIEHANPVQSSDCPNEVMRLRWLRILDGSIPACDLIDVNAVIDDPQNCRQFAAEYSQ